MIKRELLDRIKDMPDTAEIRIHECGAPHDWTPQHVFVDIDGRIMVQNMTNRRFKQQCQRWPS